MTIRYERHDKIAVFTLDNPPVNALTPEMHKSFHDHMASFLADRSVHVGILTGKGSRAFCAGDDIKHDWGHGSLSENLNAHFWPSQAGESCHRPGWEREVKTIERYKPIIGAVNGPAMGMGLIYLLCHTDLRVAAPSAKLGFPEIAYGMAGAGGTTQLSRHLPPTIALWMLLTGEPLSAELALKHDLVNEVVAPDRLMERASEIAERIAQHPPLAVRVEMELHQRGMDLPRREAIALTNHLYRLQRAAYLSQGEATATPLGNAPMTE